MSSEEFAALPLEQRIARIHEDVRTLIQRQDDLTHVLAVTRREVSRLQFSTTWAMRYLQRVSEFLGVNTADLDSELLVQEDQQAAAATAVGEMPTNPIASEAPLPERQSDA